MQRNTIYETLRSDMKWDIDGKTIKEAIEYLTELAESTDSYPDAYLDFSRDEDEWQLMLMYKRLENDEEVKQRQDEAMQRLLRIDQETKDAKLRQFERLKKELNL